MRIDSCVAPPASVVLPFTSYVCPTSRSFASWAYSVEGTAATLEMRVKRFPTGSYVYSMAPLLAEAGSPVTVSLVTANAPRRVAQARELADALGLTAAP
jgi:hypothetical protein